MHGESFEKVKLTFLGECFRVMEDVFEIVG
jgi:hypothetical protein